MCKCRIHSCTAELLYSVHTFHSVPNHDSVNPQTPRNRVNFQLRSLSIFVTESSLPPRAFALNPSCFARAVSCEIMDGATAIVLQHCRSRTLIWASRQLSHKRHPPPRRSQPVATLRCDRNYRIFLFTVKYLVRDLFFTVLRPCQEGGSLLYCR